MTSATQTKEISGKRGGSDLKFPVDHKRGTDAEKLRAVDFFCGGGGMSHGLRNARIDVVAGIDNDPACRETYEANHPNSPFIMADIKEYPVGRLEKDAGVRRFDDSMIFVGCSPCQYWSVITGRGYSERKKSAHGGRNLLRDFLCFVEHYRPGFVVVENVRGIEKHAGDSGLAEMRRFFDDSGYKHDYEILSTNDFGVPQSRRRFILIASRVVDVKLPTPRKNKTGPTVFDAIGPRRRLPFINAGECAPGDRLHKSPNLSATNLARLKLTPQGGNREHWHQRDDLQIDAYRGKSPEFFRENYGRMAWHKPAPTITTKFFALGCGRFGHPEENRAISLREGAMLQTFPKRYKFTTSTFKATARIIGNAVPPKFAEAIGRSIQRQWRTSSTQKRARG